MLYALNDQEQLQSIYQKSFSDISRLKERAYYCPSCREPVRIRSGPKVIPHFAHLPDSRCPSIKGGESEEHEAGKWLIYQWLRARGYQVELESYLPGIQQQPDVYIYGSKRQVAVEYQCSTIPVTDIWKRTKGYVDHGIFPLWILGPRHWKKKGPHILQFNSFLQSFLYQWSSCYQLFFLHPRKKTMTTASGLRWLSPASVTGSFHSFFLPQSTFPQIFSPGRKAVLPSIFHHWKKSWHNNRSTYRREPGSKEKQFRQYLYLKGYHFSLIPSVCYLPVESQVQLSVKPYIWQTRLLLDHFTPVPIGSVVEFPKMEVPVTINQYKPDPVSEYAELLSLLNILKKTGNNKWVKTREVAFPATMEEAFLDDRTTLAKLKNLKIM
ncbi:competence protein CoiA family protein [Halobacillus sp. Cin3]|uniref:competence protein CoiA n=1 Tax=Halobacillus sp. Cin3 TaxID=2928441 RepID=UPI00248E0406|nr:competence protein CoiA family protein [Halobacillus sp. Cin3]